MAAADVHAAAAISYPADVSLPWELPPSKVRLMSSTASVAPTTDSSSQVEVTVPLRADYGSILRLIAASLGADAGFSVDDIDDLRLALSEVFSSFVDRGGGAIDARVVVTFDTAGTGLAVSLSAVNGRGEAVGAVGDHASFELDELATSIIGVAVDEFEFVGGTARLVKFGVEQPAAQSDS